MARMLGVEGGAQCSLVRSSVFMRERSHHHVRRRSFGPECSSPSFSMTEQNIGKMEWSQDNIMILIDLYRSYPLLWDSRHDDFHNANKKDDAWQEIADSLEVLKEECRKKMESLKGSYRREKGKIKRTTLQGHEEPYRSRWFAFSAMQFLEEKTKRRETIVKTEPESSDAGSGRVAEAEAQNSAMGCCATDMCLTQNSDEGDEIEDGIESSDNTVVPYKDSEAYKSTKLPELKRKREDICQYIRNAPEAVSDTHDECSSFGSYVANKLKKYGDRERAIAQHRIGNVFFEIDMLLYE